MIQSYIIQGNQKETEGYFRAFCDRHQIDRFDQICISSEKPLGISEVRDTQKRIMLKPLKGERKAVALQAPDITREAQNALLKTLEEPPESTFLFLLLPSIQSLLPTVLSRCKLIRLEKRTEKVIDERTLEKILHASTGEKLAIAESFGKTREDALQFLENLLLFFREKIIKRPDDPDASNMLFNLEETGKTIRTVQGTNVNPRFSLEQLLLRFPNYLTE